MKNKFNKPIVLFIIPIIAILSVFLTWVGYVFITYCISILISKKFKLPLISGIFFTMLILASLISTLSLVLDIILPTAHQFSIIYYVLLSVPIIYFLLNIKNGGLLNPPHKILDGASITGLIVAIASVIFVLIPVINIKDPSQYIQFLSSGEDNASHFAMLQYNIKNQSPPYFNNEPTGLISSLNIYPQGIQSFSSFTYWIFVGENQPSVMTALRLYSIMMALITASLGYICVLIMLRYAHDRILSYISTLIFSSVIFIGATLFLVIWGFVTQIAALSILLSIIYLAILRTSNKTKKELVATLTIFSTLITGVTFSWYLLTPIACISLLPLLISSFKKFKIVTISYLLLTIFLSALPILINYFLGKGSGAINEPGGVYRYDILGISTIVIGVIFSLIWIIRPPRIYENKTIRLFLISSIALTLSIGSYQLLSIGSLQYYFHKSLFLLFIIGIILLSIISNKLIANIKIGWKTSLMVSLVFFLTLTLLIRPDYPRVYLNNWFNHLLTSDSLSEAIASKENQQPKDNVTDVLYISRCNSTREYLMNRWTGALFLSHNDSRDNLSHKRLRDPHYDPNNVLSYSKIHPGIIAIVDKNCP